MGPLGNEQPGVPLLMELLLGLREHPAANKAVVVERWREHPDGVHLAKLAAAEPLVADTRGAVQELQTAVSRLIQEAGPGKRTDELLEKAKKMGLTNQEKLELDALLKGGGTRGPSGKP